MNYKLYTDEFINNKYSIWYFSIIDYALQAKRQKDIMFEKHHILPSCVYTDFKNLRTHKWNAVYLTPREHFICHWLLTKCFNSEFSTIKMKYAFQMMRVNNERTFRSLTPGQYNAIKLVANHNNRGKSAPMFGKKHSEETKRKISEAVKSRPKRERRTDELVRLRTMNIGRKQKPEFNKARSERMLVSNHFKGKHHTDEYKQIKSGKMKDTFTIHRNGLETKRIKRSDFYLYEPLGWQEGFITTEKMKQRSIKQRGRKFIHKDGVTKLVTPLELSEFLLNGWLFGHAKKA